MFCSTDLSERHVKNPSGVGTMLAREIRFELDFQTKGDKIATLIVKKINHFLVISWCNYLPC